MTAYAYCRDCNEVTTGVMDLSKGFLLGTETNHIDCEVIYLDPQTSPPPIANAITRLAVRPDLCTDNGAIMLKLGLAMHDYLKEDTCPPPRSTAQVAESTWTTSPAHAQASAASTRSQRAFRPISDTSARVLGEQMSLFGEAS